ncbi:MAG: DUF1653 domain-containing protein [Clostridia bacterium]|nr:DUF1653 domain-containing protein [Clostridia bacterium]
MAGEKAEKTTEIKTEIKRGKYRHYKGNEYEVLGMAKHSETLEDLVIYRALYGNHSLWARPAVMWNEKVTVNGKEVKRFEFIE